MDYQLCESLVENESIHCAALVITENFFKDENGHLQPAQPSEKFRNGTITFITSEGKVYGITCFHVVKFYRKRVEESGNDCSHSMRTMVNGFYEIMDTFIRPKQEFGQSKLDIAIRELNPGLLDAIGKRAIDLDSAATNPEDVKFGYAVGFPEKRR